MTDVKESIFLRNGELNYKKQIIYLGLLFSDTGSISYDIHLNVSNRRSNVSVKFSNFCARNYLAPLKIKLAVLHSCVMSSLCYGIEVWGDNSTKEHEKVYKMGLKTALSVRFSTCDEIVYTETGTHPIKCIFKKRQIKFWSSLLSSMNVNSPLFNLIQKARDINLPYITYYENLISKYKSAEICYKELKLECIHSMTQKIRNAFVNDPNSKLGTYLQVNPDLTTPKYSDSMYEIERIHVTRFRTGSHNLAIETGRFNSPPLARELRLCKCGNSIQTVHHVFFECDIINRMENFDTFANEFTLVSEFFSWPRLHEYLLCISRALKFEL